MPTLASRITIVFLLVAFLCGFSFLPFNIRSDYRLDPSSKEGVAVFSISADCRLAMSIRLHRQPSGGDEVIGIDQSRAFRASPLQWHDPWGRVVMRDLRAGDYVFSSFVIVGVPGTTAVTPKEVMDIPFTVTAGKATYLGHLNFDVEPEQGRYRLTIEDRRDRDIPLLKEHAVNIQDTDLLYAVIQANPAGDYQPLQGTYVFIQPSH